MATIRCATCELTTEGDIGGGWSARCPACAGGASAMAGMDNLAVEIENAVRAGSAFLVSAGRASRLPTILEVICSAPREPDSKFDSESYFDRCVREVAQAVKHGQRVQQLDAAAKWGDGFARMAPQKRAAVEACIRAVMLGWYTSL